ncbi:hypothetical protein QWY31_07395 [Cytophagales bacterium LB-30]|uniref:Anti-sigma factor n=1 Tax=Shiella aurantiaca TaxID=3058365 RepID=A0ABT8F4J2_9BACT|nr:hypothetical protein [Shiella aurantiaca]MDN4165320.1 hypothetical protein [Shiella aurantiaca]
MSNIPDHSLLIEQYIDGTISAHDKSQLLKAMESDPAIKSEVAQQMELKNGIINYRKAELKNRLNSIQVGSGSTSMFGVRIASGVAIVAVLLTGSILYFNNAEDNTLAIGPIQIENQELPNAYVPELPTVNSPTENKVIESKADTKREEPKPSQAKIKAKKSAPVAPSVLEPEVIESFEDTELQIGNESIDTNTKHLGTVSSKESIKIEVTVSEEKSSTNQYKFYNNKLYLYGDFGQTPYEIIEVNSLKNKSLFLFFNNEYYHIRPNQTEKVPFEQVANETLIQELKILKENK